MKTLGMIAGTLVGIGLMLFAVAIPSRSICDAAEATKAYYERHITEF
ncbi:hypothetical protein [Bradyrhizobium diazoefficiens]|nr:hypothetical protein XF16B_45790 [Bradyrhizobium diazoefficiens]BCF70232.1 hypothetical protein XF19B_45850 [Bradyrhizobium diazoefficiens]